MATKIQIAVENVASVYSGKDGKCCCGCSGKHRYASSVRLQGVALRGYPLMDEDINDVQVRRVVGIINAADVVVDDGFCVSTVVGSRLYIAYLKREGK
jgi:hypothetical protein